MKIQSVRLKAGYKRFHDLTIDLSPKPARIVALIGPNGCGKSSVLDGILYLHNAHGRLGETDQQDYKYHSLHASPGYSWKNIDVNFTVGSYRNVWNKKRESGKEQTIISFRSPYRYNLEVKISDVRSVGEIRHNNYGASTTNAIDKRMEENYRRLQAEFRNYSRTNNARPSDARDHIVGELNTALGNCVDLSISDLGDVETDQGTLYFKKLDQPTQFEFNVLSAGEKEVVDILVDLYLRRHDYDDTVFLIDEPELHINTAVQRKMLKEIDELVGDNCQIWIASHSIGFLRALQDDYGDQCQIIRFEAGENFGTQKYVLKPMPKTRANWLDILETPLDDLVGLVSPRRIVYCEGRAESRAGEERGLDAQVYNKIFGEAYPDTVFVSSGGNTEPTQRSEIAISILGKVLTDLEVLVLVERDFASGEMTTEREREEYLENNPPNHRVLSRWELENYLYDAEVLEKYCVAEGRRLDNQKYKMAVSDIRNENVKNKTGQIKKACGIKSSISAEKCKLRLAECIEQTMTIYDELRDCIFQTDER